MPDATTSDTALIIAPNGSQALGDVEYIKLFLSFEFGLEPLQVPDSGPAEHALRLRGKRIAGIVWLPGPHGDDATLASLRQRPSGIPLWVLSPGGEVEGLEPEDELSLPVYSKVSDLIAQMRRFLSDSGLPGLLDDADTLPYETLQARVEARIERIESLPTLDEIVLRLQRLIADPTSTAEDLEAILISDPAIVARILRVVNAPALAGVGREEEWTLKEAIVRLGLKQVAAIAQQIQMMTSLVKPLGSEFDLRRFWEHSVGCALLCSRLYNDRLVSLPVRIEFNDYWMGGLLHDIGKLVLGFFFRRHFAAVLARMERDGSTFRKAEASLGDAADHESVGRLFLLKSGVGPRLMEGVGRHHSTGAYPDGLICLIHLADNLAKELGLGYLEHDPRVYSAAVMHQLGIERRDIVALRKRLQPVADQVRDLVDRCA